MNIPIIDLTRVKKKFSEGELIELTKRLNIQKNITSIHIYGNFMYDYKTNIDLSKTAEVELKKNMYRSIYDYAYYIERYNSSFAISGITEPNKTEIINTLESILNWYKDHGYIIDL